MADKEKKPQTEDGGSTKKSKLPLMLGLVLALTGSGGGFYAVSSGMILGQAETADDYDHDVTVASLPEVAFVPVDPLVISLGQNARSSHLRFVAQLEVVPDYQDEVAAVMPRVLDVLNGYLRAVAVEELEEPSALIRLRAQMLRRVQIVTGEGRVRDLLVTEFVLN